MRAETSLSLREQKSQHKHKMTRQLNSTSTTLPPIAVLSPCIIRPAMLSLALLKQDAVATLDAELSKRVEALRQQYAFLEKSLRTRGEIRLSKIDQATRETKLGVLLQRYELAKTVRSPEKTRAPLPSAALSKHHNKENVPFGSSKPSNVVLTGGVKRKAVVSPVKIPIKIVKKGRIAGPTTSTEAKKVATAKKPKRGD